MKRLGQRLLLTAAGVVCLFGCSQKVLSFKSGTLAGLKNPSLRILVDRTNCAPVSGTFGWGYCFFRGASIPDMSLSAVNERLHSALREELAGKGLVFKESEPDVLVSYALASGAAIDDDELNRAYGGLIDLSAFDNESTLHYKSGVLIVDVVGRISKHLLWRGAIMAEIDLNWPDERKKERCDAVIRELLRYYPHP